MAEMACIGPLIGHWVTINLLIGRVTRPSSDQFLPPGRIITRDDRRVSVARADPEQITPSEQLLVCADPLSPARKLAHRKINLI